MNFLDSLDTAAQFGSLYKSFKGEEQPRPPAAPRPKDNTKTYLLIGGGVLALVLVLVFALKK